MSEKEGGEQASFQIISPVFHLSVNKTCILYKNDVLLCKRRGKDAGRCFTSGKMWYIIRK